MAGTVSSDPSLGNYPFGLTESSRARALAGRAVLPARGLLMVYTDDALIPALETVKREVKAQHDIVKFLHRVEKNRTTYFVDCRNRDCI